jgi:hypothetical protein
MRQTLTENALGILDLESNQFVPRPTYYMYMVWKHLMGTRILNTTAAGQILPAFESARPSTKLRAYAACHVLGNGSVTILMLNLGSSPLLVVLPQTTTERDEWVLTAKVSRFQVQSLHAVF